MKNNFRNICNDYLKKCNFEKNLKNYYKGKIVLVTGGAGAIGSNLTICLSNLVGKKGKVIVLDNLSAIKDNNPWNLPSLENLIFVKGDIRNESDLKEFLKKDQILFSIAAFFANQIQLIFQKTQHLLML